jgi:hypothetical protein
VIGIVAAAGVTGHVDYLFETVPRPQLPWLVVILAWIAFCFGLVPAFNAEPRVLSWLIPSVLATFLLQQGATVVAGSVVGTLVAGTILGAYANLVGMCEPSDQRSSRPRGDFPAVLTRRIAASGPALGLTPCE